MSSQKCMKVPTIGDFRSKAAELAKSLGADQKCSQSAKVHSTTASASYSASVPFVSAGGQVSMSTMDNSMRQDGCSSISMQMSEVFKAQNNINCYIKQSKVNTNISVSNKASVQIKTIPFSDEEILSRERQAAALIDSNTALTKAAALQIATLSTKESKRLTEFIENITSDNNVLIEKIRNKKPEINISGSTINVKSNTKFAASITLNDQTLQKIKNEAQTVVKSSAEAKLKNKLGLAALSPNSKNSISQITKDITNNIDQTIQDIVHNTNASFDASSNLVIESQGDINIENTTLDVDSIADITIQSVTNAVSDMSNIVVNKFITDHVSDSNVSNEVAGSDDLQRAMGDTIGDAINAAKVNPLSSYIGIIIIGLVAIGGAFFLYKTGGAPFKAIAQIKDPKVRIAIAVLGIALLITGIVIVRRKGLMNKISGSILIVISLFVFIALLYTFSSV